MDVEVHVIGAGIGGVAAAIALTRAGARVRVLEQAGQLTEVGAGLQISQNGLAVLRALDVVGNDPVAAVRSTGTEIRDFARGRLVTKFPPPAAGPTWYFHRADLLAALVDRARGLGVTFELGARVDEVEVNDAGCTMTLSDGAVRKAGIVIAADGGQSRSRQVVNGTSRPEFSGQVAWRATVPWGRDCRQGAGRLTMGANRHVVTYPLREGRLMNIVAVEERNDWTREGWRLQGDPDEFRRAFREFGGTVGQILGRVETVHQWALYLHPVASRWHRGSLALLGDAAHPTLPFMAQGACLALEDAWVLADCLRAHGRAGFGHYQNQRVPRARRVVAEAAGNARKFHLKGPARWIAQAALGMAGPRFAPRYEWIYGLDVTA
ncbi:FAD-dependent monooxygenase [Sedimentitalea sp. JM2-8]|uniref:FAD-dependent monooxygenase n=1 Tax=Sedimentitalea xiamensis TaxID=3050037 RepID=A0ABT7FDD0_9RHOB|nr:FAD-dependent monooxygenase [Sedimentitalea xiamensis]MDK3073117.1 FAD-dependent monooxygenase [Sedimentitalea xiamensis]